MMVFNLGLEYSTYRLRFDQVLKTIYLNFCLSVLIL